MGGVAQSQDIVVPAEPETVMVAQIETIDEKELKQLKNTKEFVEDYFGDMPVMIEVAYCESGFRQTDAAGNVLRGKVNPSDIGVMQINEKYHAGVAVKLGYDLYTTEGNLAYARYLYETQGTKPWLHSAKCWNEIREVAFAN